MQRRSIRDRLLCFVGPMVGRNPGLVTTQGEILTDRFLEEGFRVLSVSAEPNRYMRLLDIVRTIVRERRGIDALVVQVYGGPSFVVEDAASRLGRLFGHRIVMVLRGGAMPDFMARHPRWTRRVLGRADVLVAPSEYLAEAVRARGHRARVIPNVIDVSRYPYRHRATVAPRLFWMRGFHAIYHPEMAVRVLARLRAEVPDATLVMAGSDLGMRQAVRGLAASLGLADAVRFPGFLDPEGKLREGGAADIAISTPRIDNTPVALIEACAMGLPVVSTDVGGVPHLLEDGETGLLVPSEDVEAMTRAILRLLREPGLAARLSANGRRVAERSSWEEVLPQWERLLAELFEGPGALPAARGAAARPRAT